MNCPVDKSELKRSVYENTLEIDKCESCEGVWLDKGELEKLQEVKINDYSEELSRLPNHVGDAFSLARAKSKPTVNCPKCLSELERREYGYCSQILVDTCPKGHGMWLDKNELSALEIFYERARIDAAKEDSSSVLGFLDGLRAMFK